MDFEYTDHARDQMLDRRITEREIESVVLNYRRRTEEADLILYDGVLRGRRMRVVVSRFAPRIITVHFRD